MAKDFYVTLNQANVRSQLLQDFGGRVCEEEAEKIRKKCGDGYAVETKKMGTRTIASVYTETTDAMADNMAHNTLAKAVR